MKQWFPTTVDKSGTTVLPNSKIILPNINLDDLVAFSILLKPRSGQKSRDATAIAPRTLDWKSRQKETRNGGNTGIHGKRTRWGSIPPKETERSAPEREIRRSPPAAPVAEERDEQGEGVSEWVWGRRNSPCPRYNPQPTPHSGSTALEGGSTAGSGSAALEGGSTASATTLLLDQRLTLKKKRKAKPTE